MYVEASCARRVLVFITHILSRVPGLEEWTKGEKRSKSIVCLARVVCY